MSFDQRNFFGALIGDGRPLLLFTGLSLCLSGGFALFLSATGHFLPHDVQFLGITAQTLCGLDQCKIVHFMFHDRVAFGGALIAIGTLYMWLAEFPLKEGKGWSWWVFLLSGVTGFLSFLAYLGYGYFDSWHGTATLLLLPCFAVGMYLTRKLIVEPKGAGALFTPGVAAKWNSAYGLGRICLLLVSAGMMVGGLTIVFFGMTRVFVPQDLAYLGLKASDLYAVNPRLVPLIAHDRAGFGGAVCSCGIIIGFLGWCAKPCRSLWQALLLAGSTGFLTAVGIHFVIGYLDLFHLAPAAAGVFLFFAGMFLLRKPMHNPTTLFPLATRENI